MTHRVAWLIRDPSKDGWARTWRELLAMGIDPVTGLNRYATGEAGRKTEKPETFRPSVLTASTEVGMLWRGEDTSLDEAPAFGYAQLGLGYGTLLSGHSKTPFDAFRMDIRLGGGDPISEATVRGRLWGRDVGTDGAPSSPATHLSVNMAYDYHSNAAYQFGGQTILAGATHRRPFAGDWQFTVSGYGGAMLLGAMDSLYVKGEERAYDYGPGVAYGANASLVRRGFTVAKLAAGGLWLHTIDGAEAEHFSHSIRFELLAPLWRDFAIGSAGEFIQRDSYYDNVDDVSSRFPQVRVYLSWLK